MVPSLIVKITWHLPGGRYHSPSIITADRRRCQAHQPGFSRVCEHGPWTYFCGIQPVFQHAENDRRSFGMFTAQLICQGACRQVDIVRAFGVSKNSVIRSVDKYRAGGVEAFYAPRATRGASVMTPEVTAQAQQWLAAGRSRKEVAEQLGLKLDTLRK